MKTNPYINIPKYMTVVDKKLIRGKAVVSPLRLYKMKASGINQIIDLRNTSIKKPLEKIFCKILGIKYINHKYPHRINHLPEADFFERINHNIINNEGTTYIHCQYGKRRTGVAVAIYEKLHSSRQNSEILEDMIELGYKEVLENPTTSKSIKYNNILSELKQKYF